MIHVELGDWFGAPGAGFRGVGFRVEAAVPQMVGIISLWWSGWRSAQPGAGFLAALEAIISV